MHLLYTYLTNLISITSVALISCFANWFLLLKISYESVLIKRNEIRKSIFIEEQTIMRQETRQPWCRRIVLRVFSILWSPNDLCLKLGIHLELWNCFSLSSHFSLSEQGGGYYPYRRIPRYLHSMMSWVLDNSSVYTHKWMVSQTLLPTLQYECHLLLKYSNSLS